MISAQQELSVKFNVLQPKFDHFIDEHWCPMQYFAYGVVSCLAVFAGDSSFELPVRADLGSHLKYSQRLSGVCAGVLLGVQGAVRRGESRGEL